MIIIVIYGLLLVLGTVCWFLLKNRVASGFTPMVTAIVVARNEEENIGKLLDSFKNQTYKNLEIIIVNDQSDDHTVNIILEKNLPNLQLIHLNEDERGNSPKKSGITKAMRLAKGDIIFSTDGDCILPPQIIEVYANQFESHDIQFIAGPVTFIKENKIWNYLQTVEFASLIGSAAVAFFLKKPIMSSAANLAYRKSAFLEVNGFEDNKNLASGDDEFLMNKIVQRYPESAQFIKDSRCIVKTKATQNLKQFYQQRKRWAGKWKSSINLASILTAIFVFTVNAVTIYYIFLGQWEVLLLRFIPEVVFLGVVLWFLKRKESIIFIPLTQLIYPFYAVFFGIVSLKRDNYLWKERSLK